MQTLLRWDDDPALCDYRPDHLCLRENIHVISLDRKEYSALLVQGWRRFGHSLFRVRCLGAEACRQLRIDAASFRPNRSQRRCRTLNEGTVRLEIGRPTCTLEKLTVLDRFHADRSARRDWPPHAADDAESYNASFVDNPFPSEEWCYFIDDILVGVGYVDQLPVGLSAIYFAHDPAHRARSLGTWNVLNLIDRTSSLGLSHVYLGHYSARCSSLAYKGHFRPCELRRDDGQWRELVDRK
jgi:arginine-tRNA-protein transferase